jgi:hypothetical protein
MVEKSGYLELQGEYAGGLAQLNSYFSKLFGTGKSNILLRLDNEKINVLPCYPLSPTKLVSDKPIFTLEYKSISSIQNLPASRISFLRVLTVGIFATTWRKKEDYLNLTFKDDIDMDQNIAFKMKESDVAYQAVYNKVAECRRKQKEFES